MSELCHELCHGCVVPGVEAGPGASHPWVRCCLTAFPQGQACGFSPPPPSLLGLLVGGCRPAPSVALSLSQQSLGCRLLKGNQLPVESGMPATCPKAQ